MSRPESNRSLAQRPNSLMWDFGQVDLLLDQGGDLSEDTDERPSLEHQREFHDYFYQLQFQVPLEFEDREIDLDELVKSSANSRRVQFQIPPILGNCETLGDEPTVTSR